MSSYEDGTSSTTLKRYEQLLNSSNKNDLEAISHSDGYLRIDNLPSTVDEIFKNTASVFIFIPNPIDPEGMGHWCLFTRVDENHFEYFDPQRYWFTKGTAADDTPEEIERVIDNTFKSGGYKIEHVPLQAPIQAKDSTTCGLWCILRQTMLHLDILSWFLFITETCSKADYPPDYFVRMLVCPVIDEKEE